jgi:ABC-type uncharacterized transport system permease subunit
MTEPKQQSKVSRRILGSFLSTLSGWFALNGFISVSTIMNHQESSDWWYFPIAFAIYSAMFIFGTWLLVLLPLYLLVPLRSSLWRWYICTPCGVASGAAIMFAFTRYTSPQATDWPVYVILAAIVGGITCLFGSLTSHRFHYDQIA